MFEPDAFSFQLSGHAGVTDVYRCLPFSPPVLAFVFIAHTSQRESRIEARDEVFIMMKKNKQR